MSIHRKKGTSANNRLRSPSSNTNKIIQGLDTLRKHVTPSVCVRKFPELYAGDGFV